MNRIIALTLNIVVALLLILQPDPSRSYWVWACLGVIWIGTLYKCNWLCSKDQWPLRLLFAAVLGIGISQKFLAPNESGSPRWNSFMLVGDSPTYLMGYTENTIRPPVYPWFNELISGLNGQELFRQSGSVVIGTEVNGAEQSPFLRIVRAQKILLLISLIFLSLASMLFFPAAVSAAFFLWLFDTSINLPEINLILSETLAQSFMFMSVAALLFYLGTRRRWWLLSVAFFCGLMVNTRSAFIFSTAIISIGLVVEIFRARRVTWASVAAAAVFLALFLAPGIHRYWMTGCFSLAPMHGDSGIIFALQIAQPEDVASMPDELSRTFLERALEKKRLADEELRQKHAAAPYLHQFWYLNSNLYIVAHPVSASLGLNVVQMRDLYLNVTRRLYELHPLKLIGIWWESFLFAMNSVTRIPFAFYVIGITLIAALWLGGNVGILAVACMSSHILHLAIISSHDQPLVRYVYVSESLIWIASCFILAALVERLVGLIAKRMCERSINFHACREISHNP